MSIDRAMTPYGVGEDIFVPADDVPAPPTPAPAAPAPPAPPEPELVGALAGPALVAAASGLILPAGARTTNPRRVRPRDFPKAFARVTDPQSPRPHTSVSAAPAPEDAPTARVASWTPVLPQVPPPPAHHADEYADQYADDYYTDDDTGDDVQLPAPDPATAPLAVVPSAVPPPTWTPSMHLPPHLPPAGAVEPPAWIAPPPVRPRREPRPELERTWSGGAVVSELTSDAVVRPRPARPEEGWRRAVFELTGGRWNPGLSPAAAALAERRRRIQSPVRGCRRVAVLSVKGGVGKTTVAAMLGLTYAELRGDRVLAIDANPDLGTLADRLTGDVEVGMQHLLDFLSDRPSFSINDIERFVSATSRLQVLAGSQEPCGGSAFTREEYEEAIDALSSCYNVMIIDTGTGLSHAALAGVLATADSVVIVGEPTVDAASRASMTLDWLTGSGFAELAEHAIVVMSQDRGSREIDQDVIIEHFENRCGAVVEVPADLHLAAGGRIARPLCHPATQEAFEELAAVVADRFPTPAPRRPAPEGP